MDTQPQEGAQPNQQPSNAGPSAGDNKKLMAVFAYVGPLIIVSYIVAKDNPFVKFHIKQGLVLFIIEIAVWFLGMAFWPFWMLLQIVNLAMLILSIVGIINAVQDKETELPVVGHFAKSFSI